MSSVVESGLSNLLQNDATVNGMVAGRVYFSLAPKEASRPYVVIHLATNTPLVTLDDTTLDLDEARFQFDCYADDYLGARNLSKAIKALLQDFTGQLYTGTLVQACIANMEMDSPYEVGGVGYLFRRILDITLFFVETTTAGGSEMQLLTYTGAFDGTNADFDVSPTPSIVFMVFYNGLLQGSGDYTLVGNHVHFFVAPVPNGSQNNLLFYGA